MATKKTIIEITLVGGEKIKADLDKIGESGQRALNSVLNSSKPVPASLRAVDAVSTQLTSSFDKLAAKAGPLGGVLRALGPAGLVAAGAAGAAGGLFIVAKRAIETADELGKTAEKVGLNVEVLQEYGFAANVAGISQEKLNSTFKNFIANVGLAREGTGPLVKGLKDTNTALLENIRSASSMEEALELAFQALADESDAAAKATLANKLFGKSMHGAGIDLLPMVAGLKDLRQQARELGVILSEDAVRGADKASDQLDILSQVISINMTRALLNFAPMIGAFTQSLVDASAAAQRFFSGGVPDTTLGKIKEINAEIVKLSEQRAKTQGVPLFTESQEELSAKINALKEQRALLEQLAAKQKPSKGGPAAPLGPTVEELEAQKKAAREFASEQKSIAEELIKLHQDSALAELEGIAKIEAARDQEIKKYQEALDKKLISEEQFVQAREDLEKKAQAEITKIQTDEQKKRDDAREKLAETIRDSEQEVTEAVAKESDKRRVEFENETEDRLVELQKQAEAAGKTEAEITAILADERERRKTIWKEQADDASEAASIIGDAFEDMITGIALGTQDLDFDGITDALKAALAASIKEKLHFDELFRGNIFDLMGTVADIVLGNGGLTDIFGAAFDLIIGKKGALDAVLGKGGSGGGSSLVSSILASYIGSEALGTAGAAALGNSATIAAFIAAGGSFVGPSTALTASEAALLFPSGAVPASFGGTAAAGTAGTAGAAGGSSAATLSTAGYGALFTAAAVIGDRIGQELTKSSSPQVRGIGRATDEFVIPRDAQLAFQGEWKKSLEETAKGLLIGGPAIRGIFAGVGFDPLTFLFGEETEGTQFRTGIGQAVRDLFPDLELLFRQFEDAEEMFPELFESALPPIRAVATAIAELADTPLETADEVSQLVNVLVNSMAAEGKGAADAVELARRAMEELGITTEDAGRIALDAMVAGRISVEEFEQVVLGLAEIAGVPFEVMRDAILATITDAEELRRALEALGDVEITGIPPGTVPGDIPGEYSTPGVPVPEAPSDFGEPGPGRRFHSGGIVGGPRGSDQIILAAAGETIWPTHDRAEMRAFMARQGVGNGDLLGALQRVEGLLSAFLPYLSTIANKGPTALPVVDRNDLPRTLAALDNEKRLPRPQRPGILGIRGS